MKQDYSWYADAQKLLPDELKKWGKILIIAPHQDDESLGCGGTIALLRKTGIPVHVVFVSDGSKSHPNSKKYPYEKLVTLRENEAVNALEILNVDVEEITFLRLKDSELPVKNSSGFENAVHLMQQLLLKVKPQTVILPWQRDPHKDHRATWEITDLAIKQTDSSIRKLEYLVWLWERGNVEDLPQPGECKVWEINIEQTIVQKKQAIAAHISQITTLIDDDPEGFILSPEVLAHFNKAKEIFVEKP